MEFSNNFFEKETRCDFEISSMMKRAWAAQMEVLKVVGDVCEKHGLQYFADWGTLLGAVRHKGFIPWDDDIDICLKRKDYMKLIQILPRELPKGFVLAGMYSSTERLQNAAYVPHIRVIADELQWNFNDYMKYFHGFPYQRVGIDIFPLDNIGDDEIELKMQRELARKGIVIARDWKELERAGELENNLKYYGELCNLVIPKHPTPNWLWHIIDALCALHMEEETTKLINWPSWTTAMPCCLDSEWYDDVVYLPFEHMEIPAPVGYDKVLQTLYGDYMVFVREEADHTYPFYKGMEDELKRQIRAVGFTGEVDEFCEKVSTGEKCV